MVNYVHVFRLSTDADDAAVQDIAMNDENVNRFILGKTLQKAIVVPGRLINLVVR